MALLQLQKSFTLSKNVSQIRYDPPTKSMEVDFTTGKTYRYKEVPEEVWLMALNAESIGSFIHSNIKGRYSFQQV